jgi:hypothetical protein
MKRQLKAIYFVSFFILCVTPNAGGQLHASDRNPERRFFRSLELIIQNIRPTGYIDITQSLQVERSRNISPLFLTDIDQLISATASASHTSSAWLVRLKSLMHLEELLSRREFHIITQVCHDPSALKAFNSSIRVKLLEYCRLPLPHRWKQAVSVTRNFIKQG